MSLWSATDTRFLTASPAAHRSFGYTASRSYPPLHDELSWPGKFLHVPRTSASPPKFKGGDVRGPACFLLDALGESRSARPHSGRSDGLIRRVPGSRSWKACFWGRLPFFITTSPFLGTSIARQASYLNFALLSPSTPTHTQRKLPRNTLTFNPTPDSNQDAPPEPFNLHAQTRRPALERRRRDAHPRLPNRHLPLPMRQPGLRPTTTTTTDRPLRSKTPSSQRRDPPVARPPSF